MIKQVKHTLLAGASIAAMLAAAPAFAGKTVDAIKARGQVICGVNVALAGFSQADSNGNWTGLMSISAAPLPRRCSVTPPR